MYNVDMYRVKHAFLLSGGQLINVYIVTLTWHQLDSLYFSQTQLLQERITACQLDKVAVICSAYPKYYS